MIFTSCLHKSTSILYSIKLLQTHKFLAEVFTVCSVVVSYVCIGYGCVFAFTHAAVRCHVQVSWPSGRRGFGRYTFQHNFLV